MKPVHNPVSRTILFFFLFLSLICKCMGAIVQIQHLSIRGRGKKSSRQSSLQFQEEEGTCIGLGSICAQIQLGSLDLCAWSDEELYRICRSNFSTPLPSPIMKLHICNHNQKYRDSHNPCLQGDTWGWIWALLFSNYWSVCLRICLLKKIHEQCTCRQLS